jgi:hypothetical protein
MHPEFQNQRAIISQRPLECGDSIERPVEVGATAAPMNTIEDGA